MKSLRHALVVLCVVVVGTATATDLPKRKPGLWETTMHPEASKAGVVHTRMCLDAATDAMMYEFAQGATRGKCSKLDIEGRGGRFTMDSVCSFGDHRMSTHSTMTYTGDTAYSQVVDTRIDPPMAGRSQSHFEQQGRWVGPCDASMKPGDMVIDPPGVKINIRDVLQGERRPGSGPAPR